MRWLEVAPPGAQTRIVLTQNFGGESGRAPGGFTGFVFTTDDIMATWETLAARGVRFTEPPTRQPWGMMQALFEDPDGNGFVLVQ